MDTTREHLTVAEINAQSRMEHATRRPYATLWPLTPARAALLGLDRASIPRVPAERGLI